MIFLQYYLVGCVLCYFSIKAYTKKTKYRWTVGDRDEALERAAFSWGMLVLLGMLLLCIKWDKHRLNTIVDREEKRRLKYKRQEERAAKPAKW